MKVDGKLLLLLLALLAIAFFLSLQPSLLLLRAESPMADFQGALERAPCVAIVEELGTNDRNVMQCGVDYAADLGALGKEVEVFVFDGPTCVYEGGETLPQLCTLQLLFKDCPILYISGSRESNSYKGLLLVGVGDRYERKECSILVNGIPAYEYILGKREALMNATNGSNATEPSAEEGEGEREVNESVGNTTEGG